VHLILGIYPSPTSSFVGSSYLLDSSVNISTCLSTLVSSYTKIMNFKKASDAVVAYCDAAKALQKFSVTIKNFEDLSKLVGIQTVAHFMLVEMRCLGLFGTSLRLVGACDPPVFRRIFRSIERIHLHLSLLQQC
jgi:hypothetical protein